MLRIFKLSYVFRIRTKFRIFPKGDNLRIITKGDNLLISCLLNSLLHILDCLEVSMLTICFFPIFREGTAALRKKMEFLLKLSPFSLILVVQCFTLFVDVLFYKCIHFEIQFNYFFCLILKKNIQIEEKKDWMRNICLQFLTRMIVYFGINAPDCLQIFS